MVQHFHSTGFQDPQTAAAAETSGSYYYSSDGKSEEVGASRVRGERKKWKKGGSRR